MTPGQKAKSDGQRDQKVLFVRDRQRDGINDAHIQIACRRT